MTTMLISKKKWFQTSFVFILLMLVSMSGAHGSDQQVLLRDKQTACGIYIAKLNSEFNGRQISSSLSEPITKSHLQDFDPKTEKLVAVGAPPDWISRKKLKNQIQKSLKDAGFDGAKTTVIRRIGSFVESKVGIFVHQPGAGMVRISSLDQVEFQKSIHAGSLSKILSSGGSLVIAGTPLFAPSKMKLKQSIQNTLKDTIPAEDHHRLSQVPIKTQSNLRLWVDSFAQNPVKAFSHAWYRVRSLFPYSEDMVRPTDGEIRSMSQKVTMHTIFSMMSFVVKAETLQVMIPMTIVNATNSGVTGTYRSFIGNWMSRDGDKMAIRTLKGVMLASFFTFDMYLAKNLFNAEVMSSMTQFSGWTNFIAASWVSVLFQTMWRTPVYSVLHSWERWKSFGASAEQSIRARNIGGSAEKFMTYVMTQFWMLSIVLESSFFKLIWHPGKGFSALSGDTPLNTELGQTLLMNFNVGHLAMAMVGVGALAIKNHYKLFDKVTPAVEWLDKAENRLYQIAAKPFSSKKDKTP